MFGFAVTKIDFKWIDYVKLIETISELKVKWFVFGYVHELNELNYKLMC